MLLKAEESVSNENRSCWTLDNHFSVEPIKLAPDVCDSVTLERRIDV